MRYVHHGVLYGVGLLLIGYSFYDALTGGGFTAPIDLVATTIGCVAVALPTFLLTEAAWASNSQDKIVGADHASRAAYMRELREMDLRHSQTVHDLSMELGERTVRLEIAEDKVKRMTYRPKIDGKLVKRTDPRLASPDADSAG